MKLLVYVTPWPENAHAVRGRSGFLSDWFKRFLANYEIGLRHAGEDLVVKMLYPANPHLTHATYPEEYVELFPTELAEVSHIYRDHQDYMSALIDEDQPAQRAAMLTFFREKLNGFTPDIVIGLTPCHFLKALWPDSLCVVMEAGFFSRPPFPPTQYFDSAAHLSQIFPARERDTILDQAGDGDVDAFLEPVFAHYRHHILDGLPLERADLDPEGRYKAIVLLPLQFEGCASFDHCSSFSNQLELVEHVIPHISADTLLLITKHQFSSFNEDDLKARFTGDNIRYISEVGPIRVHVSQRLLPFVDGVVTVSSSVGMQAAIWDKFCICIGNSHVKAFADTTDIRDLPGLISGFQPSQDKLRLIAYLFLHYYVPFEFLWTKPDWCYEYFARRLRFERSKEETDPMAEFPPVASPDELLALYLSR